jgi:hypothetical protein
MSMGGIFNFLCLSSVFYTFHCTGLSPCWLVLSLGIFEATMNEIVFLVSLSVCSLFRYKKAPDVFYMS